MSKKYVPSFVKYQPVPTANTNSFRTGPPSIPSIPSTSSNKLAPLPDITPTQPKPIVNTSLPAKNAPKLAPATLASLTGGSSTFVASNGTSSGSKISFASKFKEHVRIAEDPNYKPPAKVVDFTSETDFPSLGGPKKAPTITKTSTGEPENKPVAPSFADKAKDWANKKREEEEKVRQKAAQEEERLYKAQLMKSLPSLMRRFKTNDYDDDEDDDYNPNCDQSSLGGYSYEVPENDQPPSEEEEEEENEFNQNVGWDGRRKDDLY